MKDVDLRTIIARRFRFLPARLYASFLLAVRLGKFTTLRNPTTFSELMAKRNISGNDPLVTLTADKWTARQYIADRVGEDHVVPLLQMAENVDDLDFEALQAPCVIKATHGYDMNILLPEGTPVNRNEIRAKMTVWLNTDFYKHGWKERSYRDLQPRVVVEEFIGDGVTPPVDYKFYAFNGRVAMLQVDEDRFVGHRLNVLDRDFNRLKVEAAFPSSPVVPERPDHFEEMIALAEKIAADFEFVRVDMYSVDDRVYVGEITHYPGGGAVSFGPDEFNLALGELWRHGTPIPDKFIEKQSV